MAQFPTILLMMLAIISLITIGGFGILSLREKEPRAARISFLTALIASAVLFAGTILPFTFQIVLLAILSAGFLGLLILFLFPLKQHITTGQIPHTRFDERQMVLARWRLKPGSPEYETYYRLHPEHKAPDDLTRSRPGLYSPDSLFANPLLCTSADASFSLVQDLVPAVNGPVAENRHSLPIEKMTAYIKGLAKYYGALHVGITPLQPYHVYSHAGRSPAPYGEPIHLTHHYAIALSVEMDYDMTGANPASPGAMETAKQYVEVARVAVQLAAAIRNLGYPARAHIESNYQVICPLVAQDAGLGEIGRMGLLITPSHGSRIRLAVVTTDLPLQVNERLDGTSVIDFCTICKKCAQNCPSQSISFGDRIEMDDSLRWKIDADTCIRYWMTAGTDCGRCLTVCPYSHPDNIYHNLVRVGIQRSPAFRRAALRLDDLLYGRKPAHRPPPAWTDLP
jgi:ferredoxin